MIGGTKERLCAQSSLTTTNLFRGSAMADRNPSTQQSFGFEQGFAKHDSVPRGWISNTLKRLNNRNKERGFHRMRTYDMMRLLERANGHCEVTGLRFSFDEHGCAKRKPFIPSIDRKDSSGPYSFDNCRLVCLAVNFAMNQWGIDVLDMLCRARLGMIEDQEIAPALPKPNRHELGENLGIQHGY